MFTRKPAITRLTVGPRGSRETWPNERDSRQLMDCTALPNGRECRRGERWLSSYITAEILLFHCALTTESVWLRVCVCAWNIPGSAHKELSCGAFIYSIEAADVVTQRHQRRCFQSVARLVGDHILRIGTRSRVVSLPTSLRAENDPMVFTPGLFLSGTSVRAAHTNAHFQTSKHL